MTRDPPPQPPWPHLITDDGLEYIAAVVSIVLCNTRVARCSRQLIDPADWVFVTLGPLRCDSRRLPTVHIVTQCNGSGRIDAYLSGQLASFSALTLLVGHL